MKLLLAITVVYAFLLSLLDGALLELRQVLARLGCHRTDRHGQTARVPLYRLRAAISQLWLMHRPQMARFPRTPG